MSLLNRPSDGLHNVLVALYGAIVEFGPQSRDQLVRMCSHPQTGDDSVLKTLKTWLDAGLFVLTDRTIDISPSARPVGGHSHAKSARIAARALAMSEANNKGFDQGDDASQTGDFTRAISWLLAQDVLEYYPVTWDTVERSAMNQVGEPHPRILVNDTRWAGLQAWGRFLGFLSNTYGLTIDPSLAVRDVTPDIFRAADTRSFAANAFVEHLSAALPVLDGGRYRVAVEGMIDEQHWLRPPAHALSSSLSLAMTRLEAEGVIRLELMSDSADVLELSDEKHTRVSHVLLGEESCQN